MATDLQIEQLFESARPRIADIMSRTGTHSGRGNAGCALMVLSFLGAIGLLVVGQDVAFPSPSAFWGFVAAVLVGAILCVVVGWKLWRPWSLSNAALQVETDDSLLRPLADALVPGGTFSRPSVTVSGFHPSLLLPQPEAGRVLLVAQSRVDGRLAGMPVVIEETESHFHSRIPEGWIARFELPFAVAGHLRIWVPGESQRAFAEWKDGFAPRAEAEARLGAPYAVDVAPLGTGPDATAGAAPDSRALPPEAVCTDALFDALRARPDARLAVVGRTLWILLPRPIKAFVRHIASPDDLAGWQKAGVAARDLEAIAREVAAAAR